MTTNLRARRRGRKITQTESSDLLGPGATQTAISHWEHGQAMPHKPMRKKLEAVFALPIDELMATDADEVSEEAVADLEDAFRAEHPQATADDVADFVFEQVGTTPDW